MPRATTTFEIGESEANAELIAAAPELLRLLQAAYETLRSYQHGNRSTELAREVADEVEPILTQGSGGE